MTKTTTPSISKTEQRELDSHAKLREQFAEAYAAFETSDHPLKSAESKKLATTRDKIGSRLHIAAEKLRKRGYELRNDDSIPGDKKEPEVTATATPTPTKTPDFEWPQDGGRALVIEYVTEHASAEADAPNKGLPFITEGGILRIRAEHWREWIGAKFSDNPPSKLESARPIREQFGYSMKPFAIPGEKFSHGFYTGQAPTELKDVPRRIVQRAAAGTGTRTPKAGPFGRFDAETLGLLKSAVTNYPKRQGGELRVKLLAELEQASDALAAAAAQADAAPSSPSSDAPSSEDSAAK